MIRVKNMPEKWEGEYLLRCKHNCGGRNQPAIYYVMYCNLIKLMNEERAKVKIFGYRYFNTEGEKIRYIDKCNLMTWKEYKKRYNVKVNNK